MGACVQLFVPELFVTARRYSENLLRSAGQPPCRQANLPNKQQRSVEHLELLTRQEDSLRIWLLSVNLATPDQNLEIRRQARRL